MLRVFAAFWLFQYTTFAVCHFKPCQKSFQNVWICVVFQKHTEEDLTAQSDATHDEQAATAEDSDG